MTVLTERPTTTFAAPHTAFAPEPAERRGVARDAVRLLVARGDGQQPRLLHARFGDLPDHVHPGDLLVVNNSATIPGEVDATHRGQSVVIHLANRLDTRHWVLEMRTAPDAARAILTAAADDLVHLGPLSLRLVDPWPTRSSPTGAGNRLWRAECEHPEALVRHLHRHGRPIAYGYLRERLPLADYQTVFGAVPGSAEMASAGRPFTAELVTALVRRGVQIAPITLHTGVSSQEAGEAPGPEWYAVPEATARHVEAVRAGGGRVIAVGTTATRALESAVVDGRVVERSGWTDRVVTPGAPPQVVSGLITGWHDPMASHLLLVEAVAGARLTQAAYDAASSGGYLWHEFGDAALLLP